MNKIKNTKIFTFTDSKAEAIETNEDIIKDISNIPPVLIRPHREDLIEWDLNEDDPLYIWNLAALRQMDNCSLRILRVLMGKLKDQQIKKY